MPAILERHKDPRLCGWLHGHCWELCVIGRLVYSGSLCAACTYTTPGSLQCITTRGVPTAPVRVRRLHLSSLGPF